MGQAELLLPPCRHERRREAERQVRKVLAEWEVREQPCSGSGWASLRRSLHAEPQSAMRRPGDRMFRQQVQRPRSKAHGGGGGVAVGARWHRSLWAMETSSVVQEGPTEGLKQGRDVTFSDLRFQWGPAGPGLQGEWRGRGGCRGPGER